MPLSPVSIQTQPLALRALRKRKPQEMQALALATMIGCHCFDRAFLLAGACVCCVKNLAVFVYAYYATHATQAIAFEWKPGFRRVSNMPDLQCRVYT